MQEKTISLIQWLWILYDSSEISFNESLGLQFSGVVVNRLNYISDTLLVKFAALRILYLMVCVKLGWFYIPIVMIPNLQKGTNRFRQKRKEKSAQKKNWTLFYLWKRYTSTKIHFNVSINNLIIKTFLSVIYQIS